MSLVLWNRDFDAFDLRLRLPYVVSKLHKAANRNGGITYIHCTAGLGRAPATAVRLQTTDTQMILIIYHGSNTNMISMIKVGIHVLG